MILTVTLLTKLVFSNGSTTVEVVPVEYNPSFEGETTVNDGFLSASIKTEAQRYSFEARIQQGNMSIFNDLRAIKQSQFSSTGKPQPITCEDHTAEPTVLRTGLITNVTFENIVMKVGDDKVSGGIRVAFTEIERNY